MIPLSVLDLSPVPEGSDAGQSLRNTLELAQQAEKLGFTRYWLAEHHNMPGIASAATSVVIGHVAAGTSTIRVGAGGIMLPNHSPLVIAEQFGTLASLFPGRIDLGLGRAPGTDQLTAHALRRNLESSANDFPRDVVELLNYFKPADPAQRVQAVPGAGLNVPVWILGSSLFGAQLAAMLGLPYGFASHFAPADMERAVDLYRERFEPSEYLQKPYVMLGLNVIAADTDEEAHHLFTSQLQAFVNLRSGRPGKLPAPVVGYQEQLDPSAQALVRQMLSCRVVGGPETVDKGIREFAERTGADELMVTGMIYDHQKRLRSYEIVSNSMA
ncbi:LLM class flavin-dependent oxidoreductase [Brucella pituitosa]|uniref:Luciferase-like monooxygenase n=1 Tax=Brucella pituitosa TaxID=571256 RepID=A0A643F7R2_9HYPH|nr:MULTISPECIES: LLM class flavin-dependent oxidoreductase [Brucella]PQZ51842.1 LLM class flavin-dependent oxidoreductase [Ochrobactrum sp. MYb19]PRA56505.1 LLM class flavin-dependent oxidoreductase [Ochrobactrum sp. MYb68]PRA65124.1 LLM class flavin-dependent oxidoreductase [Ochrobactrum sp. MYb18]PRA76814.1 LLM class flavin-dependent oxidoreductase [Brucella thiophenivorans]PRA86168.1 LLM class flavin-dependent oxidoreductase [Ochrobactrum sp. MYb29]PRA93553.1 LLM class flavin-dependent oxi